ncbi:MAG: hypothetical protein ACTHK1_12765 [Actinomycetales bacterium]
MSGAQLSDAQVSDAQLSDAQLSGAEVSMVRPVRRSEAAGGHGGRSGP